jgi:hypothetical protein
MHSGAMAAAVAERHPIHGRHAIELLQAYSISVEGNAVVSAPCGTDVGGMSGAGGGSRGDFARHTLGSMVMFLQPG